MNFLTLEVMFGKENPYVQIWQKKIQLKTNRSLSIYLMDM